MNCWPGSMDCGEGDAGGCQGGCLWARESGRWGPAHLVLLGELEAVVGLEAFCVLRHVRDGDGWVAEHACGKRRPNGVAGHSGASPGAGVGGGRGGALQCESAMDELQLEGVAGEGKAQGSPRGGRDPRPARLKGGARGGGSGLSPSSQWPPSPVPPCNQLGMQGLGKGQRAQDFKLLVPREAGK